MRCLILTLSIATALSAAPSTEARNSDEAVRVLFVGNSLTYVGNLPRVVEGISATNGRVVSTEMIAAGGATLTQHLADPETLRIIANGSFDYVVLQERGGDLICSFGPSSCVEARLALSGLSVLVAGVGSTPISLGTYQYSAAASERLVAAEIEAAEELGLPHLSVSDLFQRGMETLPDATWLATDGMHPGRDLTLLKAVLVYSHIFGVPPTPMSFTVAGEMRDPGQPGESQRRYSAERINDVLSVLELAAIAGGAE